MNTFSSSAVTYVIASNGSKSLTWKLVRCSVARWFVYKPKIQIWVNFEGPYIGKCWYILWSFGIVYGHLRCFVSIGYILCSFGTFFPVLVSCTKKNLATLARWTDRRAMSARDIHIYALNFFSLRKISANFFHLTEMMEFETNRRQGPFPPPKNWI
jgi:hypothetical protein